MIETPPFFIVGSSRSGTTLLRLMISGHSRIHIPPETWFILPLVHRFSLREPLSRVDANEVVRIAVTHFRWADLGIDGAELQRAADAIARPRLRDLIDIVYDKLLAKAGKQRIGDKTPLYIGIVPELAVLYPEARFIHLIRDGRDVAISFIEANFSERCYDGEKFEWIAAIRSGQAYRNSPHAKRIMEMRYDDLVRQPESTIREICDFLGEQFEPRMLEYRERQDFVPIRGRQIHANLARPISDESIGAWRRKLSGFQCFSMEACMGRELTGLGYPLRFGAAAWRPLLVIWGAVLRSLSPLLDRAIPSLQRRGLLPKPLYF